MQSIQDKITAFQESTFIEGNNRFPGYVYGLGKRIDLLGPMQLEFQKAILLNMKSESAVEEADIRYAIKCIDTLLHEHYKKLNTVKWNYIYSPYFTEQEVCDELVVREFTLGHRRIADPDNYAMKLHQLMYDYKNESDPEKVNDIEDEIISMGWNPEVEYNTENMILAKSRIESKLTAELNGYCRFIDISDNNNSNITAISETTLETNNDACPVVISINAESGEVTITDKVTKEVYEENSTVDVYTTYTSKAVHDSVMIYKDYYENSCCNENRIFIPPSNYLCASVVSEICTNLSCGSSDDYVYIYRLYSGDPSGINESALNNSLALQCRKTINESAINFDSFKYTSAPVIDF